MHASTHDPSEGQLLAPQLRVHTLGRLHLAWLDPHTGSLAPLPAERLNKANAAQALCLFKALLSCPDRFATTDWLLEQFWPDLTQQHAQGRLHDVVSSLRGLLRHAGSSANLVQFVYGPNRRGAGYRLEGYPAVWCDADALEWYVQHALLLEQRGEDATACWERAYQLGARGEYLPEQVYEEWARQKRDSLAGLVRDCVHHWTALLRHMGQIEEAIVRLRGYWLEHRTDEDVLRVLLEWLAERERFGEAERCYAQGCAALGEEGMEPDGRTRETMEVVRAIKVRRPVVREPTTQHQRGDAAPREEVTVEKLPKSVLFLPVPTESSGREPDADAAEQAETTSRRQVLHLFRRLTGALALPPDIVTNWLGQEHFSSDSSYAFTRNALTPEQLHDFVLLTHICRRLSDGNELQTAEKLLWSYLPRVEALVKSSSEEPPEAAAIVAEGYLLAASLAGHRNDLHTRRSYSEQAVWYGQLAQDPTLQVAALRQVAVTFNYQDLPHHVLETYQRALPLLSSASVPALLRSCIYAALAGVHAKFQHQHEADHYMGLAYDHFGEQQGETPDFLRSINASENLLLQWDGNNHLRLGRPHLAEIVLLKLDVLDPQSTLPKRIRIEAIDSRARMFVAVGNLEQACLYLEAALRLALEVGSRLRLRELAETFQLVNHTWPGELQTHALLDLFIESLLHQLQ